MAGISEKERHANSLGKPAKGKGTPLESKEVLVGSFALPIHREDGYCLMMSQELATLHLAGGDALVVGSFPVPFVFEVRRKTSDGRTEEYRFDIRPVFDEICRIAGWKADPKSKGESKR